MESSESEKRQTTQGRHMILSDQIARHVMRHVESVESGLIQYSTVLLVVRHLRMHFKEALDMAIYQFMFIFHF
jgi:hypothetical protein